VANHIKQSWEEYITQFEYETFVDESLKRQFELLQTLGVAALSEEDLTNVLKRVKSLNLTELILFFF
jgi:ribosome assembly protein YihI (activator of Der GTPase)